MFRPTRITAADGRKTTQVLEDCLERRLVTGVDIAARNNEGNPFLTVPRTRR